MIERRIITGLIVSADYLARVAPFWDDALLEAPEFRRVARWCLEFYATYNRAPDRAISDLFLHKVRDENVPKAEAQLIETALELVSDEYERGEQFNSAYLYDRTVAFFRDRELAAHNQRVEDLRQRGRLEEAAALAGSFRPRSWATSRGLELGSAPGYARVAAAFARTSAPVIRYPGALGELLNSHLVRDGFVAFMGPEKRGKTFWLTDLAFRALRQKSNVAFFQAGDLSESQMLRRIAVHVARRPADQRYCAARWRPVGDCAYNQFDDCARKDRNGDRGVYETAELETFKDDPDAFQTLAKLAELARANPDYRACDSAACDRRWPVLWLTEVAASVALDAAAARRAVRGFFKRWRRRFRLVCYATGTLTTEEMRSCLDEWERQDDFVPDVIVVDYSDIMTAPEREFRHRQNEIWKGLRAISQERHALVATATQADAASYRADLLQMKNFTEDKRKHGHVTAEFGLNQDAQGREKALGVMRLNAIVAREGDFSPVEVVCVLQDLAAGRPFTGSFRPRGGARAPAPSSGPEDF